MASITDAEKDLPVSWGEAVIKYNLEGIDSEVKLRKLVIRYPNAYPANIEELFKKAHQQPGGPTEPAPAGFSWKFTVPRNGSHKSMEGEADDESLMVKEDGKRAEYFEEDRRYLHLKKLKEDTWNKQHPNATEEEKAAFFSTTILNPTDPIDKICPILQSRSKFDTDIYDYMEILAPETMKKYRAAEQKRVYENREDDPAYRNALLIAKGKTREIYEAKKKEGTELSEEELKKIFDQEKLTFFKTFARNNPEKSKAYIKQGDKTLEEAAKINKTEREKQLQEIKADPEKKREAAKAIIEKRIAAIKEAEKGNTTGENSTLSEYQMLLTAREVLAKSPAEGLDSEIHDIQHALRETRQKQKAAKEKAATVAAAAAAPVAGLTQNPLAKTTPVISEDKVVPKEDLKTLFGKEQPSATASETTATPAPSPEDAATDSLFEQLDFTEDELAALLDENSVPAVSDDVFDETPEEPFDETGSDDMPQDASGPDDMTDEASQEDTGTQQEEDQGGSPPPQESGSDETSQSPDVSSHVNDIKDQFGKSGPTGGAEGAAGTEGAAASAEGAATAEGAAAGEAAAATTAGETAAGSAAAGTAATGSAAAGSAAAGGAAAAGGTAAGGGAAAAGAPVALIVIVVIILIILIVLIVVWVSGGGSSTEEQPTDVPAVTLSKTGPVNVENCSTENPNICDMTYELSASFPGSADDVIITDPIPENAEFVSATGTYRQNGNNIVWSMRENQSGGANTGSGTQIDTQKYTQAPYSLPIPQGSSDASYTDDQIAQLNQLGSTINRYQGYLISRVKNNDPKYVDPFLAVIWSGAIEGTRGNNYSWNCRDISSIKVNDGCIGGFASGRWQVSYGIQVSQAAGHIIADFETAYGIGSAADPQKVQQVGQSVIDQSAGSSAGQITNPATFPAKKLSELTSLASSGNADAQQALAILLMDPDLGAISISLEVAKDIQSRDNWRATMEGWGSYYINNMQSFSNRMQTLAQRYSGGSGGIFGTQTFKLTLRPKSNDTFITNQASVEVIGARSGSAAAPQLTDENAQPSEDNCSNYYDLSAIPDVPSLGVKKNFGDPTCKLLADRDPTQLDSLFVLLKDQDGVDNADMWYNVIIPCTAPGYAANNYTSDGAAGRWGLYGMGASQNGPGTAGDGPKGQYDRGDVQWIKQTKNAVAFSNSQSDKWSYWRDICFIP